MIILIEEIIKNHINNYMVEIKTKFSTMDVLAPISMKNAAKMRYAM